MKNFKDTKTYKRIIMALIIIMICAFCFSGKVQAKDSGFGGKLLNPIVDLIVHLGDGCMNLIHSNIYHQGTSTITIDMTPNIIEIVLTIGFGYLVANLVAAALILSAGALAPAFAAVGIASISAGTIIAVSIGSGIAAGAYFHSNALPDDLELPVYMVSPEEIFSNKINLFDVDFFNPNEDVTVKDKNGNVVMETIKDEDGNESVVPLEIESTAKILRGVVSNWYNVLRDIAVVALLSVLVYTGIRILLSLTSNDKAKYKQMLVDWLVAICLLFFMQYIMSFSNIIVDKITDVIKITQDGQSFVAVIEDKNGKIEKTLKDDKINAWNDDLKDGNDIYWPTNLMGMVRVQAQYAKKENASYAGYGVMFIVLVLFTIYFIFTYLKRVLYMAFLTIIAPLVALTYPIDKMNDGKAQAFNRWFKEYIFNLLIQPLHLIIYTILVTSAFTLASENIIYSLVALGFMMPAEKLMRKFFGFEKADTPGLLAGSAGAAIAMTGMNKLLGLGPKSKGGSGSSSNSKDSGDSQRPPRVQQTYDEQEGLLGGLGGAGGQNPPPGGAGGQNPPPEGSGGQNPLPGGPNGPMVGPSGPNIPRVGMGGQNPSPNGSGGQNPPLGRPGGQNSPPIRTNPSRGTNSQRGTGNRRTVTRPAPSYSRGVGAGIRYFARGTANQMRNSVKQLPSKIHPIKTAGKLAAGAAGAAALGMAGLALGVTSGDPTKAAQYTAGAMFGGYKAATGGYDVVSNSLEIEGVGEAAQRAYYGSDEAYDEHQQEKYKREFQRNEKNMLELEMRYGRDAGRIMKNDVPQLLDNGIYDMKDITAIEDAIRDPNTNIRDLNEAMMIRDYRSRLSSSTSKMKEDDKNKWRTTFKTEFDKKYSSKDDKEYTTRMASNLWDKIEAYDKIRDQKD